MENLQAHQLPLFGKHLIEASAGTGKTFNITRIYLRLLLERKLTVEQILVMTFTKDATEEIKGRIDTFIRETINQWHDLVLEDVFFKTLAEKVSYDEAMFLLKQALLFLDDAAIFTIHGFCKRVLNQHAFSSGVSFSAKMETDCQDIVIQACQDWYRKMASSSQDDYLLMAEFWPTPESFISQFSKAIARDNELAQLNAADIKANFQQLATNALAQLKQQQQVLTEHLVLVKKGLEQETRQAELDQLLAWLEAVIFDSNHGFTAMPVAFMDGRRFSRSKNKVEIIASFEKANEVKAKASGLKSAVSKAHAYTLVKQGIIDIRAQVSKVKQQQSILSFDDLIATLAEQLKIQQANEQLAESEKLANILYQQFPVALVDEFQDTDPLQFSILQAIYYQQKDTALYMIGDPKQAIYGFRGGDVFAYLSARDGCDYQWLMDTNWRSSAPMIQAYNRLFYGNSLNEQAKDVFGYGIPYQPVNPSPKAQTKQFNTGDKQQGSSQAMQFIHFSASDEKNVTKQSFRAEMANWCAVEIAQLLETKLTSDSDSADLGPEQKQSPQLQAQDIAILVRDGAEAASIREALQLHSLASVFLSNRANLFHSDQAKQLLGILKSILFVENERLFTAGLANALLGFTPNKLYELQQDDFAWQTIKHTFVQLRQEWQFKGFISMALKLMHENFIVHSDSQDRELTNLLHLFELLQSSSQRLHQPQELLFWFEQQINADNPEIEAELRLESDDNLIRIVTQHGSKGLEYPVVFVPFATRYKNPLKFGNKNVTLIEYHNEQGELVLSLDGDEKAKQTMADEAYAESIRLLYVAITRAEQRCYIFTTPFENYHQSPLGCTLKWQKDQPILADLKSLAQENPTAISVREVFSSENSVEFTIVEPTKKLTTVPTFTSKIERDWWLSSFSALSKNLKHGGVSLPDRDAETLLDSEQIQANQIASAQLRFSLTKGAHTGNLLHEIFEHLDFNQPDWQQALKWPLARYSQSINEAELTQWLLQTLQTKLIQGSEATAFSLAQLTLDKTLRESEFYFPMVDAKSEQLTDLLTKHRQIEGASASRFNIRLPAYKKLKGMMHGFIDLIFEHQGKFYLCDYKSSHLGDNYASYSKQAMRENVESNYYDLQYLIYSLALHRQLKFSIKDYDPTEHFGGVYYLYLRGMSNDSALPGSGVYHRVIDEKELNELDQLFASDGATINA